MPANRLRAAADSSRRLAGAQRQIRRRPFASDRPLAESDRLSEIAAEAPQWVCSCKSAREVEMPICSLARHPRLRKIGLHEGIAQPRIALALRQQSAATAGSGAPSADTSDKRR